MEKGLPNGLTAIWFLTVAPRPVVRALQSESCLKSSMVEFLPSEEFLVVSCSSGTPHPPLRIVSQGHILSSGTPTSSPHRPSRVRPLSTVSRELCSTANREHVSRVLPSSLPVVKSLRTGSFSPASSHLHRLDCTPEDRELLPRPHASTVCPELPSPPSSTVSSEPCRSSRLSQDP